MIQPSDPDLSEARDDIQAVHDQLRDALPILINLASAEPEWPDSLLGDVAVTMERSICRLDAAAGLLTPYRADI